MCVQYHGGFMINVGDILSTVGVQYRGDIMSAVGVILSIMGDVMIHVGDIMSTVQGVEYRGVTQITKDVSLVVLNTPTVLMISSHVHHDTPMVLCIPHSTQDNLPWYS